MRQRMVFLTDMAMAAVALGTAGWVLGDVCGLHEGLQWLVTMAVASIGMTVVWLGNLKAFEKDHTGRREQQG